MSIIPYSSTYSTVWNDFVRVSKNGTFLLEREYMEYHSQRFKDCSLLIYEGKTLIGLFPANWDESSRSVCSHQGLTYGGLIYTSSCTILQVVKALQDVMQWYVKSLGALRLIYKTIPYIYHQCPAQEDLYALFLAGAQLTGRSVGCVVSLSCVLRMRKLRLRGVKKALIHQLTIAPMDEADWHLLRTYWTLLSDVLAKYHSATPVHSFGEMQLLMTRFPQQIQLYVVRSGEEIVAGCLVFLMRNVARIQYIASNDAGRELGALDYLFHHLINERFRDFAYIDMGTSMAEDGVHLNEGLIFQKEGFGARAVCFDTYSITL